MADAVYETPKNVQENTATQSADQIRESRRRQVVTGDLAPDFLRIAGQQQPQYPRQQPGQVGQQPVRQVYGQQYQTWPAPYAVVQQPMLQAPPNAVGRLIVTVEQAKLAKNYGLTRMDPYCRVAVGHSVLETPTAVNGAKNPRWNKTFACYLPNGVDTVGVEIFNEMTLADDDRIAWGSLQLPAKIFEGTTCDEWLPLSGKQGDGKEGMVHLVLTLESIEQLRLQQQRQQQQQQQMIYASLQHQQPQHRQQQQQPPPPQGQSARPQAQPITDADIGSLQEMFPDTDTEVVRSVLEANNGDKDAAITALLECGGGGQ